MTIEELYAQIGGNYDDARARLQSDALIARILESRNYQRRIEYI